jgi:hypothetical protein
MTYSLYNFINHSKERVDKGLHNSIPLPFERFKKLFPGFVKGKYWIITAGSSIGKTRFTKFVMYETWKFCKENNIPFSCTWFALEESEQSFLMSILLIRLNQVYGIVTDLHTLMSLCGKKPTKQILEAIKKEDKFINEFRQSFNIVDNTTNPKHAFKKVCNTMTKLGKFYKDSVEVEPNRDWKCDDWDTFIWNNKEAYHFVVNDHISLWSDEDDQWKTIDKWSKKYVLELMCKRFGINAIDVQQQALDQEKKEYNKQGKLLLDRLMPSANYLADNKTTVRNADVLIGLFSPFKFRSEEEEADFFFKGYDISKLENFYRCITINKDRSFGTEGTRLHIFFNGATNECKELPYASYFESGKASYDDWVKQ